MSRLVRLMHVVGKRKFGIFVGLLMGVAACLIAPLSFSFVYSKIVYWLSNTIDGQLETPITILMLTALLAFVSLLFSGLRVFIAYVFRGRKYRTRKVILS